MDSLLGYILHTAHRLLQSRESLDGSRGRTATGNRDSLGSRRGKTPIDLTVNGRKPATGCAWRGGRDFDGLVEHRLARLTGAGRPDSRASNQDRRMGILFHAL